MQRYFTHKPDINRCISPTGTGSVFLCGDFVSRVWADLVRAIWGPWAAATSSTSTTRDSSYTYTLYSTIYTVEGIAKTWGLPSCVNKTVAWTVLCILHSQTACLNCQQFQPKILHLPELFPYRGKSQQARLYKCVKNKAVTWTVSCIAKQPASTVPA